MGPKDDLYSGDGTGQLIPIGRYDGCRRMRNRYADPYGDARHAKPYSDMHLRSLDQQGALPHCGAWSCDSDQRWIYLGLWRQHDRWHTAC